MAIENMLSYSMKVLVMQEICYMDVADPSLKPDITPIPQNGADDLLHYLNDVVSQKILTSHSYNKSNAFRY